MTIVAGQTADANDFISESERDATPANDVGRVVKIESDAKVHPAFIRHGFGGDGSDGDLIVTSGTTTLSCGSQKLKIFNYKSISITGTGAVNFNNTVAEQIIIIKCQRDAVLTSSATPMLDASGLGGTPGSLTMFGSNAPNFPPNGGGGFDAFNFTIQGAPNNAGGSGFPSISIATNNLWFNDLVKRKYAYLLWGGGGGASGGIYASYPPTTSGFVSAGGAGGGCIILEVAGGLNFTTALGISVKGLSGTNGNNVGGGATANFGAGGGGGGGFFYCVYGSLIANSGSVDVSAGGGGTGIVRGSPPGSKGGGGGASLINSGGTGGASSGASGGAGLSVFVLNTEIV